MERVSIDDEEFPYLEMFRAALSEEDNAQRMQAITNVKHAVKSDLLEVQLKKRGTDWMFKPENENSARWLVESTPERLRAETELAQTMRRYEGRNGPGNERKLNVGEVIGRQVWISILESKFQGMHTKSGILEQVREHALRNKLIGARDLNGLRNSWIKYRGVVHLGLAMDLCDEHLSLGHGVLEMAELIRLAFSQKCPRGTSKPYVDPADQISFVYKAMA